MKKYSNTKFILLVAILILISGCSIYRNNSSSINDDKRIEKIKETEAQKNQTFLIIKSDDNTLNLKFKINYKNNDNKTLWQIMKDIFTKNGINVAYQDYGGDLGIFITEIEGKKNGENGNYWQYFINGKYANIGVSNYILKQGDIIEWRFTASNKYKN